MKSRVTERLQEGPAPEVLEHLYVPRLQAEFADTFSYMTAVNKAHVLMLARQEIIGGEPAAQILRALRHSAQPCARHCDSQRTTAP